MFRSVSGNDWHCEYTRPRVSHVIYPYPSPRSRLFFRAAGENIKMVAVDEPSASLDPEMEYELFERLRELSTSKGKTMVWRSPISVGLSIYIIMPSGVRDTSVRPPDEGGGSHPVGL